MSSSAVDVESNPRGYQLMAQIMLSHHVLSDEEAFGFYSNLRQYEQQGQLSSDRGNTQDDDEENGGSSGFLGFDDVDEMIRGRDTKPGQILDMIFSRINQKLGPYFGLEIATAVVNGIRYHAMINIQQDDVVRLEDTFSKRYNAHERAYIRLLLTKLVDLGNIDEEDDEEEEDDDDDSDDDSDDNDDSPSRAGKRKRKKKKKKAAGRKGNSDKSYAMKKSDCINLRSELSNNFKLSLDQATYLLDTLLEDKYLQVQIDEDGPNSNRRRESVQNKLELAPRAFLELSHILTEDYGMNPHQLPQFLYHRD